LVIGNDERGFAEAIAWVAEHAPGPRLVIALEGTRSYGIGLARALQAAGLPVVEIERPRRAERRRGKSDPIDAHLANLAALHALRLDADRLPTPCADGDREALRILLGARRELTTAKTRTINRRSTGCVLLLTGNDTDRSLSRGALTSDRLAVIARRRGGQHETRCRTRAVAVEGTSTTCSPGPKATRTGADRGLQRSPPPTAAARTAAPTATSGHSQPGWLRYGSRQRIGSCWDPPLLRCVCSCAGRHR
jgi:Transposase